MQMFAGKEDNMNILITISVKSNNFFLHAY